jgi:hypothetical protein
MKRKISSDGKRRMLSVNWVETRSVRGEIVVKFEVQIGDRATLRVL